MSSTTTVQKPLVCSGHSRPVPFVAYSQITEAEDNFFMISGCLDGKAMLRVGKTGDWIGTFMGHKGAVYGAQLNKDATKAVTGAADYTAKIWDATSGTELHSFEHNKIVKSVDFSVNGERIVTADHAGFVRIYDVNKPDAEPTKLSEHKGMTRRVVVLSENNFVSAGHDGIVRMWDFREKKVVHSAKLGGDIRDVSLSVGHKPGKAQLVCTSGRLISFLNAADLSVVKQHTVKHELTTGALNVKLNRFLAAGGDFWAKVYDYASGELLETHKGHHGPLHCMRVAPDLATYCSASEDGTIRLWQSEISNYGLWVLNDKKPENNNENSNNNNNEKTAASKKNNSAANKELSPEPLSPKTSGKEEDK